MFSLDYYEKLKGDLNRIFVEGINLDDDAFLNLLWSDVNSSKDVLELAKKLKGEGNSLFKQEQIGDALETYGYAEVLLARWDFVTDDDKVAFSELALCILLNTTACLSREREFVQVGQLCSVVLDFNPNNVKALFRRAIAALELGKPQWAYWDLGLAIELEPKNQEIFNKFKEVQSILYKENSANNSQGFTPIGLGLGLPSPKSNARESLTMGNDNIHNEEQVMGSTTCKRKGQWETNLSSRSKKEKQDISTKDDMGSKDKKGVLKVREEKMNEGEIDGKSTQSSIKAEPIYRFDNRKRPGSSISISGKDYELLLKGKAIHCFNSKLGTPMTICVKAPKEVLKRNDTSPRDEMDMVGLSDQGKEKAEMSTSFGETTKQMEGEARSKAREDWELLSVSSKSDVLFFQFTAKPKYDESFNSKPINKLKMPQRKPNNPLPKKKMDLDFTPLSSIWLFDACRYEAGRKRKLRFSPDSIQYPRKKSFVKSCNSVNFYGSESHSSDSCSNEFGVLDLGGCFDVTTQDVVFDQ